MENPLWGIYNNLFLLMQNREWVERPDKLLKEEFDKTMRAKKCVLLSGKNRGRQPSTMVLTTLESNVANHKDEFEKIILPLSGEIILISNKHLTNNIASLARQNGIRIFSYLHSNFAIDITKGPLVHQHILPSKDEIDAELNEIGIDKLKLPLIRMKDPQVIWLGAYEGDVIKIIRTSEATGFSIAYRVVINK